MEHKLDEPCVHIYAAMGLYEESVELALKVSQRAVTLVSLDDVSVAGIG